MRYYRCSPPQRSDGMSTIRLRTPLAAVMFVLGIAGLAAAQAPAAVEHDFVAKDFRFASGETMPSLTLHYRTLGAPRRDASGVVRNAVLILHGTGGSG